MWVVVSSWNPLKIYIYRECYFRFSGNDYDPSAPGNLFAHLTNNSIAKQLKDRTNGNYKTLNKIPGNMWTLTKFKNYLARREKVRLARESRASESVR